MSRRSLLRILDAFFRHRWWYVLPALLLVGVGLATAASAEGVYRSSGVMYAESETLLSRLTAVRGDGGTGYETPASLAGQQMNGLLQTDEFVRSIAARSGLEEAVADGTRQLPTVRSSISVWANGYNLVQVAATDADPQVAYQLVRATVDTFIQWVVDANLSDSSAAEGFLGDLVTTYRDEVQGARAELDAYLRDHPGPAAGRPLAEQVDIDRLTSVVSTAEARYAAALTKSEDARLATAQTKGDVAQRLRLVDAPEIPTAAESTLQGRVLTVGMFLALALLLTSGAVVAASLVDTSFRFPADVGDRLHRPVLAVLPEVRGA